MLVAGRRLEDFAVPLLAFLPLFLHAGSLLGISVLATGYKGKSCPSTAFFSYSMWQKNTNIHYQAGFNSIYVWNIELNILDLSGSLFKTEKRHLDFCLKMFITASKKVLSICQTHSVTTYLDQVQMFLLPQIYIQSETRKRERLLFFFCHH